MTTLQPKRPTISNWFSSLRRQPKNKKAASSTAIEKQFQRSCIDLSSNSTFYLAPEKAGLPTHSTPLISTSRTPDVSTDEDNDQLCAHCCCRVLSPPRCSSSPFKTVTASEEQASNISAAKSSMPVLTTLSSEYQTVTDVSTDVSCARVPSVNGGGIVCTKRSEYKRTTTTKSTTTLIITRPVELLVNERGEIVSRRRQFDKARSNSLDCVLDGDVMDDAASGSSGSPSTNTSLDSEDTRIREGELRFIDDNSTNSASQSENERNAVMREFYRGQKIHHSRNNYNNSKKNNYSNNLSLCDVCRNVLQLNRNNIAKNAEARDFMRFPWLKQIKDELCEVVSEMEALDVPEDCKHSNKDKQISIGRKKFNMDPKKGIEYLVENRLLRMDPQDVAHFLYKGEGLNKTAIGDYLGEKNDFNEDVLKAFVALHDFTNLILVQALRQFLWSFRLPGEAQKIDRMMETFAQRYCQLNPDIFTNTDTCYVLSFAIIMLNTSLHNPSVKDKPSVEQFISMNRGINNGGDLPRSLLESLYESIRTEPFKIPQDDGNDLMHTFFNPDKEGWLWKQGGRYKSWKRRWFILNDNCLYYFEYTTDKEPRGIIPLENISVREIHDRSKPHCFELFATGGADIIKACKTDSEGKVVEGKHSVYRMSAATEDDQREWIKRLTQSISHNPFYDILVQRKKKALSKS